MPVKYLIQLRRGTAALWKATNPVLMQGEEGVETDTWKRKIGDGATAWNSLLYNDNEDEVIYQQIFGGSYMTTYSRVLLSGSTNGRNIPVAAATTPGTAIHTAVAGAAAFDDLYLWAANVTAAAAVLTLEWGGVTDPGDHMVKPYSIPANSPPIPIATGQVLNNGLAVKAFCPTVSAINISGYVNRIQ